MALTLCPNCRLPIHESVAECPLCAAPSRRSAVPTLRVPIAAALAVVATVAVLARRHA